MKPSVLIGLCLLIVLSSFLIQPQYITVQELQTTDELKRVYDQNKAAVIFFYSPSCGACKRMTESFSSAAKKASHALMVKINVQNKNFKNVIEALNITAVPTIITRQVGLIETNQFTKQIKELAR